MSPPPLDLFLFDLAGTTIRDDGLVRSAFQRTCLDAELPVTAAWLRTQMGHHKQEVFAAALAAAGRDATLAAVLATRFEAVIAERLHEHPPEPTPGAREAIASLEDARVRVGFVTGFSRRTTDLILQAMGWQDRMSVASDEVPHGRPHPDLVLRAMQLAAVNRSQRVGVAGDTPADLQAGTAAGCGFVVGVGCGTHPLAELALHPHTHLLADLRKLPEVLLGQG
jgi:phosphonatase-like hydrolase